MKLLNVTILLMTMALVACGGGGSNDTEDQEATPIDAGNTDTGDIINDGADTENTTPEDIDAENIDTGNAEADESDAEDPNSEDTNAGDIVVGDNDEGNTGTGQIDLLDFSFVNTNLAVGEIDEVLITIFDADTGLIIVPSFTETTERVDANTFVIISDDDENIVTTTISENTIEQVQTNTINNVVNTSIFQRFADIGDTISMDVNILGEPDADGIGGVIEGDFTTTCVLDALFDSFDIGAATNGVIDVANDSFTDVIRIVCTVEVDATIAPLPDIFEDLDVPENPQTPPTIATVYLAEGIGQVFANVFAMPAPEINFPGMNNYNVTERL